MAKNQDVTVVADFCARAKFIVSGGEKIVGGKIVLKAVPEASFELEVQYVDMTELLESAVPTTIIALQGNLRNYYRAHGRFPVPEGSRLKVKASGAFEAPPTVHLDRLEAQVRAGGEISLRDKIRMAQIAGLDVPQAWLDEAGTATIVDEQNAVLKYDVVELRKFATQKLRQLAQDEEMEDYATAPRNELIDALVEVAK